jgi:hypothetical protein
MHSLKAIPNLMLDVSTLFNKESVCFHFAKRESVSSQVKRREEWERVWNVRSTRSRV